MTKFSIRERQPSWTWKQIVFAMRNRYCICMVLLCTESYLPSITYSDTRLLNKGQYFVLYSPSNFQNLPTNWHVIDGPMFQIFSCPDAVGVSVILFCHTSINTAQFGKIRGAKSLVGYCFNCQADVALQSCMRKANHKMFCFLTLFFFFRYQVLYQWQGHIPQRSPSLIWELLKQNEWGPWMENLPETW